MSPEHNNIIEVELRDNIKMCLDTGYGMLISSKNNSNYRNSIILIHNGLELMMKLYLLNKNKYFIYEHLDYYLILNEYIDDFDVEKRKEVSKKVRLNTITFSKCVELLSYFLEISIPDIKRLNDMRNNCVHFQFTIYKSDVRKLLVSKIYPLIKQIANSINQDISLFLNNSSTLDTWCNKINDEIQSKYIQTTAAAQKHYFEDLTETDREEKRIHENYTIQRNGKLVACPACSNNSLLELKTVYNIDEDEGIKQITKSQLLKNLSCHYCGLVINDRDQLLIDFSNNENSITTSIANFFYDYSENFPNDCDCPDDCPPDDCPDDYDCPDDCPPDDCPDDYDCPDDCPPDDCPDDYDCPDDCPI